MVHMIYCLMMNENQKVDAKLIKSLETKTKKTKKKTKRGDGSDSDD